MSIQSEMDRIKNNIDSSLEMVASRGVAVPENANSDSLPMLIQSIPSGISEAIIDVTELPTENINEDVFYRLLTGTFVYNQFTQNGWACHCVDTLPEVGEVAVSGDLSDMDNWVVTAYYNVADNSVYAYVDDMIGGLFGVPAGWYPFGMLCQAVGFQFSGVITNIMDDPRDGTFRLLLEYITYSYMDGIWTSYKIIGRVGTGDASEVFNHPSNIAEGDCSHAEGFRTYAEGHFSHTEGYGSHAGGDVSHAEGDCSHAEGYISHAEGNQSHAEGEYSHAEGNRSNAEGQASHAEGSAAWCYRYITGSANSIIYTINSTDSLLLGSSVRYTIYNDNVPTYRAAKIVSIDNTLSTITLNIPLSDTDLINQGVDITVGGMALGDSSHSEGMGTIASTRSQHAQGEYNIVDPEYDVNDNGKRGKYAHIVGNGTAENRSNAHTLDWDGVAWFAGDVKVGGTGQDDDKAKTLATEEYVDNAIADKGSVLEQISYIDNNYRGFDAVQHDDDGIYWEEGTALFDEYDNLIASYNTQNRIPLIGGRNITFDYSEDTNNLLTINADVFGVDQIRYVEQNQRPDSVHYIKGYGIGIINTTRFLDENDSPITECPFDQFIPLVAGDGISIVEDEENSLLKISATGGVGDSGLPEYTDSDIGGFLRLALVDGVVQPKWVNIPNAEDYRF